MLPVFSFSSITSLSHPFQSSSPYLKPVTLPVTQMLVKLNSDFYVSKSDGHFAIYIWLDLSVAFETIDHIVLL